MCITEMRNFGLILADSWYGPFLSFLLKVPSPESKNQGGFVSNLRGFKCSFINTREQFRRDSGVKVSGGTHKFCNGST